jgi:hypothetical protein
VAEPQDGAFGDLVVADPHRVPRKIGHFQTGPVITPARGPPLWFNGFEGIVRHFCLLLMPIGRLRGDAIDVEDFEWRIRRAPLPGEDA